MINAMQNFQTHRHGSPFSLIKDSTVKSMTNSDLMCLCKKGDFSSHLNEATVSYILFVITCQLCVIYIFIYLCVCVSYIYRGGKG